MRILFHRISVILLVSTLLLAGCQPSQPEPTIQPTDHVPPTHAPPPTPTAPPTATPTPAWMATAEQLSGTQIHLLHPWTGDTGKEIDRLVDEFNQSNEWNIHVIAQGTGSQAGVFNQVTNALAGGNPPQVIAANTEQILTLHEQRKALVDLTPYAQDPTLGLDANQVEGIPTVLLDAVRPSGAWLGLPMLASGRVMFYNQSWARELGFSQVPETPEQFQEQACAAEKANQTDNTSTNDGTGGWLVDTDADTMLSWMRGFGVTGITGNGPLTYTINQPASVEAFQYLRGLLDADCAWLGRQADPYDYFASREALFYSGSVEDILVQERTMQRLTSEDEWIVLPFPKKEGHDFLLMEGVSLAMINASDAQELASWIFMRWLAQPDHLARLSRASGSLPASTDALSLLLDFRQQHPQWDSVVSLIPFAQTPPVRASWRIARMVLEDASWQVFQAYIKPEQVSEILSQIGPTIQEVGLQLGY